MFFFLSEFFYWPLDWMLVHLGLSPALNFWVSIYTPGYREARVIPENIHTIPQAASWNSEGEGRFLELEFQRHGEGLCSLEFQRHGGFQL